MNGEIIKSIATLAGYLASLAATFMILQHARTHFKTYRRKTSEWGERLRLALVDGNITLEKYKRRLKR